MGVAVPAPPLSRNVANPDGKIGASWRDHLQALYRRTGGASDKVDAAYEMALAASPTSHRVNAGAGLSGGGELTSDVGINLYVIVTLVANLPTTGLGIGAWAYATNGRNSGEGAGAGTGCPVCWNGTHWSIPGIATAVAA